LQQRTVGTIFGFNKLKIEKLGMLMIFDCLWNKDSMSPSNEMHRQSTKASINNG